MVALERVTFWPELMDVLSKLISEPDVPTVRPVRWAEPPDVLIWAFAAVPAADAATVDASKVIVQTAPAMVPPPDERPKVTRTAFEASMISRVPFAK